ncbi:MAG: hypothetical protein ACP5G4_11640, partial [bacterium]
MDTLWNEDSTDYDWDTTWCWGAEFTGDTPCCDSCYWWPDSTDTLSGLIPREALRDTVIYDGYTWGDTTHALDNKRTLPIEPKDSWNTTGWAQMYAIHPYVDVFNGCKQRIQARDPNSPVGSFFCGDRYKPREIDVYPYDPDSALNVDSWFGYLVDSLDTAMDFIATFNRGPHFFSGDPHPDDPILQRNFTYHEMDNDSFLHSISNENYSLQVLAMMLSARENIAHIQPPGEYTAIAGLYGRRGLD